MKHYLYKYRTPLLCVVSFFTPIVLVLTGADVVIGDFVSAQWEAFADAVKG